MNKVLLRFKSCSNLLVNNLKVNIFDSKNNLILNKKTDNLGNIEFIFSFYDVYKIIIYTGMCNSNNFCIPVLINNNSKQIDIYLNCINKRKILLTDKNYVGLPIEKGEILLWKIK